MSGVKNFVRGNDYQQVHPMPDSDGGSERLKKKLLSNYTFPMDKYFARGPIGLIYALWLVATGVVVLLQLMGIFSDAYRLNAVLSGVELGVTAVGVIALAVLSRWSDESITALRRSNANTNLPVKVMANVHRSRANVLSDWNVLSRGLVASIVEASLVFGLLTGINAAGTTTVVYPAITVDSPNAALNSAVFASASAGSEYLRSVIFLYIVIKVVVLLGQSLDRSEAVRVQEKLNKLYKEADRLLGAGETATIVGDEQIVSLGEEAARDDRVLPMQTLIATV